MIIVCGETGRHPERAVDIEHGAAAPANQVMMIVAHSVLVPGRGSGRLNPADEALVGQDAERVVYRLARDRSDDRPDIFDQFVSRSVGM